jgi:flagellar protein FlbD
MTALEAPRAALKTSQQRPINFPMIRLTRFNGEQFVLNSDQIELLESTPDTVISLLSGKKLVVRESVDEVIALTLDFSRRIHHIALLPAGLPKEPDPE